MDITVNAELTLDSGGSSNFGKVIVGGEVKNSSSGTETRVSDDEGEFDP